MEHVEAFLLYVQCLGKSFGEQIDEFQTVRWSKRYHLLKLSKDLHDTLQEIWNGSKIFLFGSLMTGLGLKDSDSDFYVRLPIDLEPHLCVEALQRHVRFRTPFQLVGAYMSRNKIPLLTLHHPATGMTCDITFNAPLAVSDSRLLKYLLSLDKRALQLAFFVKYWSRVNELTASKRLSNNVLTLMVVTFLQEKAVLPSVRMLQQNAPENLIDGWNAGFVRIDFPTRNFQPLHKLTGEFFVYYSAFDFEHNVVCPYLGRSIHRSSFEPVHRPRGSRWEYNCMNVQEVFDLGRNCAANVPRVLAMRLVYRLRQTAHCYNYYITSEFIPKVLLKSRFVEKYMEEYHNLDLIRQRNEMSSVLTDTQIPKNKGFSWCFYFGVSVVCFLGWCCLQHRR